MKQKYCDKDIISQIHQIDMGPTDEFMINMKQKLASRSKSLEQIEDKKNLKVIYRRICYGAICALFVLSICGIVLINNKKSTVTAENYSYEVFDVNSTIEISDEVAKNMRRSDEMAELFVKSLPYAGKYKAEALDGDYTVDGISAADYPDYYAGKYINVDGKLIIVIKSTYYKNDYRNCDWYFELASVLGSEDFACRSAKYNYSEVIEGMSDVYNGMLAEQFKNKGVEVVGIGINDYLNAIEVEVKTKEDAEVVSSILKSDMYKVIVVGNVTIMDN